MSKCLDEYDKYLKKVCTFAAVLNKKNVMYPSVKKATKAGLLLLVVVCAVLWCARNPIMRQYANHKLAAIEKRHHIAIRYQDMKMEGLSGIRIDKLSVVPEGVDTLFYAGSFGIKLSFSKLLLLEAEVQYIEADGLSIRFIKQEDGKANFDFLYKTSSAPDKPLPEGEEKRNYAAKARRTLDMLFNILPANASLRNFRVSYLNKGDDLLIEIPDLSIRDNSFDTHIRSTENGIRSEWICEGVLQDQQRKIKASLYAKEDTKITLPFLNYRWGAVVQFDTLSFEMNELDASKELQSLCGRAHISGLTLHQERISPDTVLLDKGTFAWQLNIGRNYLELDSTTEVSFNRLDFHPYLKVERGRDWQITASVEKRDFEAGDFFASLPKGLFYNLEGLEAEGTLSWHFLLDVDFAQIDSLQFESAFTSRNFRILKYGNTDLRKMNDPFEYTAYENGQPVRTFEVGPGNPSFRPYEAVSRYLPLAIMQSEDAGFFQHAGFIPSAFRESLIQDLKERRFARGASTLSMQLVKNVFLSRNKTVARKLEEILIVWLIENNRLTSKERMFEVYLNIVEWGPLVYGAAEASRFYFGKEPADLTLSECIYLASIIPKPKHFRNSFDGLQLKPYHEDFFRIIVNRMIDRERIVPGEAEGAGPDAVKITGPAKYSLAGPVIE